MGSTHHALSFRAVPLYCIVCAKSLRTCDAAIKAPLSHASLRPVRQVLEHELLYPGIPSGFHTVLNSWEREAQKFHNDEITKGEYDHWRYHFPETAEDVMDTREPQALNSRVIDKLGLRELLVGESTSIDLEAIMRYREERKARKKHDDGNT